MDQIVELYFLSVTQSNTPKVNSVSTSTQTSNDEWIQSLQKCGAKMLNATCRICGSTSVQAVHIYNKLNKFLNLIDIVHDLLPIKVRW